MNPERTDEHSHNQNRKGGSGYEKMRKYRSTGIPGAQHRIRSGHARKWRDYKKIIAHDSQIHHQWMPGTAKYTGLALVEANQHMQGIIKVIKIVCGKITLLTEKEIRELN